MENTIVETKISDESQHDCVTETSAESIVETKISDESQHDLINKTNRVSTNETSDETPTTSDNMNCTTHHIISATNSTDYATNKRMLDYSGQGKYQTVSDKILSLFPNKKHHIRVLFRMYKFIFAESKKEIWDKSESEVVQDIQGTPFSFDFSELMNDHKNSGMNNMLKNKQLSSQLGQINIFIDFAYLYYVQYYDKNAPMYQLPTSLLRYKLLMAALRLPKDNLYNCFEFCITNEFIKDLQIKIPPFNLRTELSEAEIRHNMATIVQPVCKEILSSLFELYRTEFPVDANEETKKTEEYHKLTATSAKKIPVTEEEKLEEVKKQLNPLIVEALGDQANEVISKYVNTHTENELAEHKSNTENELVNIAETKVIIADRDDNISTGDDDNHADENNNNHTDTNADENNNNHTDTNENNNNHTDTNADENNNNHTNENNNNHTDTNENNNNHTDTNVDENNNKHADTNVDGNDDSHDTTTTNENASMS
jgi:hypothetical protein